MSKINTDHVAAPSSSESPLERVGALLPGVEAMQEQVRVWRQQRQAETSHDEVTQTAEPAQVALELQGGGEVADKETLPTKGARPVPALLEYELARRGFFHLEPNRQPQKTPQETEDLVGTMIVETPRGQLSVFELELMTWIMGRWDERGDGRVRFTLRECARDFGSSWGGSRAEFLLEALDRLHGTRFKVIRYDGSDVRRGRRGRQNREGDWEHLIDRVQWKDRADSALGPSRGHMTVKVTLGSGLIERLCAKQVKTVDWVILHRQIPSELGKRLYWLLEAQKGWPLEGAEGLVVYEVTITGELLATLGCRDSHARRLRTKLVKAGAEITTADKAYRHVGVRRGKGRGVHVLRMVRLAS